MLIDLHIPSSLTLPRDLPDPLPPAADPPRQDAPPAPGPATVANLRAPGQRPEAQGVADRGLPLLARRCFSVPAGVGGAVAVVGGSYIGLMAFVSAQAMGCSDAEAGALGGVQGMFFGTVMGLGVYAGLELRRMVRVAPTSETR